MRIHVEPVSTTVFLVVVLVTTGLAVSHWLGLAAAVVMFGIGTVIRVRSEEKLLRGAFGAEFDAYARQVPALFPRIFVAQCTSGQPWGCTYIAGR